MKGILFGGRARLAAALLAATLVLGVKVGAQTDPPVPPPLATVAVPEPANLADFVFDRTGQLPHDPDR